ncbi:MAG: tRNA lysidine(34) synthetase TilS [Candidatus Atribacteria bacterium]|nr:tRNA lysidine(34) synthetase TilS [Candidatus Atribacteria bacterium]
MKKYPCLVKSVSRLIQEQELIVPGDRVLVAFSGGPDSTTLSDILEQLRNEFKFQLALFHLNHGLRGQEALRDQNFCIDWAKKRNIEIFVEQFDVKAYKKEQSISLEEAARKIRYQKLKEIAELWKADKIALGHHRNDQVETILMNIIRGTGIHGLRGMPFRNGKFIRPLLKTTLDEIHHYLEEQHLTYVVDSTNLDQSFLRNRIRLGLIPFLKKDFNPKIEEVIFRLGLNLQESLSTFPEEEWPVEKNGQLFRFPINRLIGISDLKKRRGLIAFIKQVKGDTYQVTRAHFKALENIIKKGKGQTMLPEKISFWVDNGYIYARRGELLLVDIPAWSYALEMPGINQLEDIGLAIESFLKTPHGHDDLKTIWCEIDLEKCKFPLVLRNFLKGDRVVINGKEKKLKTIFQLQGIPENWRRKVPILCDQEKILWIPGILLDERAQVQENSKSILIVTMRTYKR